MRRAIFPQGDRKRKNSNRSPPETRCQNQGHVPDKNGRRLTRCPVFVQLALSSWLNAPQSVAIHGVVQWLVNRPLTKKQKNPIHQTITHQSRVPISTNQHCTHQSTIEINRPVESSFTSVAFLLMSFDS